MRPQYYFAQFTLRDTTAELNSKREGTKSDVLNAAAQHDASVMAWKIRRCLPFAADTSTVDTSLTSIIHGSQGLPRRSR